MLKHVVFFKFKQGIGEEEIVDLEKSLAALPPVIPMTLVGTWFGREDHTTWPWSPHLRTLTPSNVTRYIPITKSCCKRLITSVKVSWLWTSSRTPIHNLTSEI